MLKYLITFLLCAYCTLAVSTTFIEKGQRAQIFELTDNEVPIFRVTLSKKEFDILKEKADVGGLGTSIIYIQSILDNFYRMAGEGFDHITGTNFFENFPNHNVTALFPELNIGEDGYPHLNKEEILKAYDMNKYNYIDFDFGNGNIMAEFFDRNPYFDLIKYSDFFVEFKVNKQSVPEKLSTIATYGKKATLKDTEVKSIISGELPDIQNSFNNHTLDIFEENENNIQNEIPTENVDWNESNTTVNPTDNNQDIFYITEDNYEVSSESIYSNSIDENVTDFIDENTTNAIVESITNDIDESFTDIVDENNQINDNADTEIYYSDNSKKFKTKKASLTVEINGEKLQFDKVTFSLAGQYSRELIKPNFNLKIRGGKNLYGRSQFKLRSDYTEPTFLRSKLTSDIHNRLGLPSISANYATLYINDEFMGLFVLTDAIKQSWIKFVYGEEDSQSLYQCSSSNLTFNSRHGCGNEDSDFKDYTDWMDFLTKLDAAESASDIEDFFEVDNFIYEMAIEYLIGGWDHIQQIGHNFYMYKQTNGKWKYFSYDYDHEFGINIDRVFVAYIFEDLPERYEAINTDYPSYSFAEWTMPYHIIDILILKDSTRFDEALKDIVTRAFNPATLFPRIDELKEFIKPYVIIDKTPDENGNRPGRINVSAEETYTLEEWDANSEFTSISTIQYNAYGIKYWILAKYRYVCKAYGMECDPIYMDEDYQYPIDKKVQFTGYYSNNNDKENECWSEQLGYPCCNSGNKEVVFEDENGNWGISPKTNDWCGIRSDVPSYRDKSVCWSEELGFPCCVECKVEFRDTNGAWGVENGDWCGILPRCRK
ncbi:hypothetical protein H8356DRAFT_1400594 [Neocallimastix lanati (nom. inval.)]|nr:hypothetical protein H8356DRAFT_1400594 [Neocallimastix sp. JGI-2020a]